MEKKLIKLNDSNYEIQFTYTDDEKTKAREAIIKHYGKDVKIPGFREGHAPANLIEEKLNPEYVTMGTYEELAHKGLHEILHENADIKFVGEPYDLVPNEDKNMISIKLDVYPEVEVIDDKRKTYKMEKLDSKANDQEVEESMTNLKKNYADYQDTDKIEKDTVSKISLDFVNKKGDSLETGTLFVGEPEFNESKFYDIFVGKNKDEIFELDYKEKDLPATFHKRKQEEEPTKIIITIKDIKKVVLPEFTEEKIKQLFPDQKEVKNEEDLKNYIKTEIEKQKYNNNLIKNVEDYLNKIRDKHMKITIPQTLIQQEFQSRVQSLEERFGGKEQISQYFQQLGEEKTKEFIEEISKASQDSLEKFFILQKITEELKIDVDRQKGAALEVEQKLYDKIMGE